VLLAFVGTVLLRLIGKHDESEQHLHLLPTCGSATAGRGAGPGKRARLKPVQGQVDLVSTTMGRWSFTLEGAPPLLFTEND
ncbi:MAG: hypothetical protein QM757_15030, partial [Paludibaculum sp.]